MPKPRKSPFDAGYIAIIDRLIKIRRDRGMSQMGLGLAYGEEQSFISRVERKQRRLDVWEFIRMCRALEVDAAELVRSVDISTR